MNEAKPFDIPKREVWEAFRHVKANQGAAGVDGQSVAEFEADLSNNLYKLWNRLSSGSYFPPPVRRVEIPKANGGTRPLGIPTVADRVAQEVARRFLQPHLEPAFHADSYGYRPGRSAHDAVRTARERCWRHDWVLDLDIKGFFDSIDWELLLKAVHHHSDCAWALLYIERWVKAPVQMEDGSVVPRTAGTPQGGVITPRTQKITSAVLAIWLAGIGGWAAFGRSVGEGNRMADHDLIITHKDLFDQQAHDLLAIEDVESMQRSAEPAEECGECFGETEIGSAVGCLIGDRLQLAARGLFTLA